MSLSHQAAAAVPDGKEQFWHVCERVLFIGTRFSNLYTSVDTPAEVAFVPKPSRSRRQRDHAPLFSNHGSDARDRRPLVPLSSRF